MAESSSDSALEHEPRLYEAEMAREMGLPFDERWYTIPVEVREYMIASRLARISIENLQVKNA